MKRSWVQKKPKVQLRSMELCPVCRKIFMSLYPLRHCLDHEELEEEPKDE